MPYLALGSLAVGAYGASQAGGAPPSIPKYGFKRAVFMPKIMQYLQMGGDLSHLTARKIPKGRKRRGGNVATGFTDWVGNNYGMAGIGWGGDSKTGQYRKGWWLREDDGELTRVKRSDTIKAGKNKRLLISGDRAAAAFQAVEEENQLKQIAQREKNFNLLFGPDGPSYLKERVTDVPARQREAMGPAVTNLARAALGGAAGAGTLTTDAVMHNVAAPLAFQTEQYFQGLEDRAHAQQLGLSGIAGFGPEFAGNANLYNSPQSLEQLQQLGLASYGASMPAHMANAQGQYQADQQQLGMISGLAGGLGQMYGMNKMFGGGGFNQAATKGTSLASGGVYNWLNPMAGYRAGMGNPMTGWGI